jgi:hypothetical protein
MIFPWRYSVVALGTISFFEIKGIISYPFRSDAICEPDSGGFTVTPITSLPLYE